MLRKSFLGTCRKRKHAFTYFHVVYLKFIALNKNPLT